MKKMANNLENPFITLEYIVSIGGCFDTGSEALTWSWRLSRIHAWVVLAFTWCRYLLDDVQSFIGYTFYPGLKNSLKHILIDNSNYSSTRRNWGVIGVSLLTTPRTIRIAENLICMMFEPNSSLCITSRHPFNLSFVSDQISSSKKKPKDSSLLTLFSNHIAWIKQFSLISGHELTSQHHIRLVGLCPRSQLF